MAINKDIEDLKDRFSVGKIPTEADFGKLIDLANEANAILGIDAKVDILNSNNLNGLEVKNKELQVKLAKNSGLKFKDDGISIATGSGISVDDTGVHLNVKTGKGITITKENVIQVDLWPGVVFDKKGNIKIQVGKGLSVADDGINLDYGSGLTFDINHKLAVNIPPNKTSGLICDDNGLRINLISNDDAKAAGTENFLTLNEDGQLGLTEEGLNRIKEGSKSKFKAALAAAVGKAVAEKKVAPDFADTLGENDSWDAPITILVDGATTYTSAEKAKERLEKKISAYLADPTLVAVRPTNDNLRINFSVKMDSESLYDDHGYFSLDTIVPFWSDGDEIAYDEPTKLNANHSVNSRNFTKPGFYAFAGKLSAPGQNAIKDPNGTHLTANAIMVYIGTDKFVYTVGYWDLSTKPLEFYQLESDPVTNAVTRNDSPLSATSPLAIDKIISEDSTENTFPLKVTGGNGTPKIYTISESKNNDLIVDAATGICIFTKWSLTPTTITVSDSPTRTKYSSKPLNFIITIKAIEGAPLSAPATSSFFLRYKNDHEVKLSSIITGRDSERGKLLSLKYESMDPNIVTVDNDGQLTILNYGAKTFILVTQKKTSLHAEKTYQYGVEVLKDPIRKDPSIEFKFERLYNPNRYCFLIGVNNTETIKISCRFYDKDNLHSSNFNLKLNNIGIENNFVKYVCDFNGVEIPEGTKYINFYLWQDESDNFNSWADESGLISTFV